MEYDVELGADSVEFCPISGLQHLFVCGTYKLLEQEKRKIGRLYLFQLSNNDKTSLKELQQLERGAILDLKWNFRSSRWKYTV